MSPVREPQIQIPVAPKLKFVKGDQVDELMQKHLHANNCTVKVVRTGPGKYLFGTKNIMAKVINGKLVIRVGGGYMGADEFIQQYGPMEMAKVLDANDQSPFTADGKSGGNRISMTGRASVRVMNDLREKMKSSLAEKVMTQ